MAEVAKDDARIATQTLRNAASYAEAAGSEQITETKVGTGYSDANRLRRTYELKNRNEHRRLHHTVTREKPGVASPDLWQDYLPRCSVKNW